MKLEMRQKLAREPFEEKIRKVGQLLRLVKRFPRRGNLSPNQEIKGSSASVLSAEASRSSDPKGS